MLATIVNILILVVYLIFLGILAIFYVYCLFVRVPFVPAGKRDIKRMVELAQLKENQIIYDLGSGDGRIVFAAACSQNVRAIGVEYSPVLIWWSRLWTHLVSLKGNAHFVRGDFYKTDIKEADVIFCYLFPEALEKLAPKFKNELKPGSLIVSLAFQIKEWQPILIDKPTEKITAIYIYRV